MGTEKWELRHEILEMRNEMWEMKCETWEVWDIRNIKAKCEMTKDKNKMKNE